MSCVAPLIAAISIVAHAGLCSSVSAKPPLQTAPAGPEVRPIAVAKVMRLDGRIVMAGDWMPYAGGGISTRSAQINAPFFDSYGREPGTAPPGGSGCGCPDRSFFGPNYHNPSTVEDMQDCACPAGSVISEVDFAWYWGAGGTFERCIVVFFPFEEVLRFDPVTGQCTDPATFTDTGGGGVAFDFGTLACGCGSYYTSRSSGIGGLGVLSPGTDDNGDANGHADGSYQMILANDITSSGIVLATGPCQPMLYGTARGYAGSSGAGGCGPGLNNPVSIDNYVGGPPVCYDYMFGRCPDPLGKMNAFCYLRCPADYNNDGFVDGIDADNFNNAFEGGDDCADLNGDCFVDGIDADYFNNEFESPCP